MIQASQGLTPRAALATVAVAMTASGLVSRRYSPDPTHPGIRRWYKRLDTPWFKPPDAVFGAGWPVLLTGLGYGAYRLLQKPPGTSRNRALALSAATLALVTTYSKITFGDRDLTGGLRESRLLVATGAVTVVAAARVDRTAALATLPLVLWSMFGGVLTAALRRRNPRLDAGAGT